MVCFSQFVEAAETGEKRWGRRKFRNRSSYIVQRSAITVIIQRCRKIREIKEEKEFLGSEGREISEVKVKPRGDEEMLLSRRRRRGPRVAISVPDGRGRVWRNSIQIVL